MAKRNRSEALSNLTYDQKKQICQWQESNKEMKQSELADWATNEFSLVKKPSQATISNILRNREKFLLSNDLTIKKARVLPFPELDAALANWAFQCRDQGIVLSCAMIQDQGRRMAATMSIDEAKMPTFSNGWVWSFMNRHNLKQKRRTTTTQADATAAVVAAQQNPVGGQMPNGGNPNVNSSNNNSSNSNNGGSAKPDGNSTNSAVATPSAFAAYRTFDGSTAGYASGPSTAAYGGPTASPYSHTTAATYPNTYANTGATYATSNSNYAPPPQSTYGNPGAAYGSAASSYQPSGSIYDTSMTSDSGANSFVTPSNYAPPTIADITSMEALTTSYSTGPSAAGGGQAGGASSSGSHNNVGGGPTPPGRSSMNHHSHTSGGNGSHEANGNVNNNNANMALRTASTLEPLVYLSAKAIGSIQAPGTLNWERKNGQEDADRFAIGNDGICVLQDGTYQINIDLEHSEPRDQFLEVFKLWNGKKLLGQCTSLLRCNKEIAMSMLEWKGKLKAKSALRVEFHAPGFAFHQSRLVIRLVQ